MSRHEELPLIGYIPMGSGNGVGSVVGCGQFSFFRPTAATRETVSRCTRGLARNWSCNEDLDDIDVVDLPMIQVTLTEMTYGTPMNELCFFAGVGFDSMMLDDFRQIKAWSRRTGVLKNILSSVAGYCVALVVRTLPQAVLCGQHLVKVKVTSNDSECVWIDHRRGDVMRKCGSGTLFEGVTGILEIQCSGPRRIMSLACGQIQRRIQRGSIVLDKKWFVVGLAPKILLGRRYHYKFIVISHTPSSIASLPATAGVPPAIRSTAPIEEAEVSLKAKKLKSSRNLHSWYRELG